MNMQITLRIDEQDRTFTNDFVKARIFRNALKINEKMRNEGADINVSTFDELIEFVVSVFNNQFTVDDVWDGIEANKLTDELMRIFNGVLNIGGVETAEGKQVV